MSNAAKKFWCLIVFLMVLTCPMCAVVFAADGENAATTVRVGFFAFPGYHEQDEDGNRSGYGYELLQRLAGYANFRYEYVGYDKSWSRMQEMLANGEIDILSSAQKTKEREVRFDFSEHNIGVSAAILTVKKGDSRFMQSDYPHWSGIRVGMIRGNSRNESFADYAKLHGFTYKPVYFESTKEMIDELISDRTNKSIDAVLTSNLRKIEGEWVLTQYDFSPFYIMARKGDRALLDRIDSAIKRLDASEPGIRTALMRKYYTPSNDGEVPFTPEERAYVRQMNGKKLKALINPDREPYSWVDGKEIRGIIYDVAQKIIKRSGLEVEFIDVQNRAQYRKEIEAGDADIRFDVAYSYNQAERDGNWLTVPYVTVPVARLYRKDTTVFKTAAAPINRDISENYGMKIAEKGLSVTHYDSVAGVVQAIKSGKQDVSFLAIDTANRAVRADVTNKLVAEEIFGDTISCAVAVNQDQSPMLYSILNKVVSSLDPLTIDTARQRYAANLTKPFSMIGYLYDNPVYVLAAVVLVLCLVILIITATMQYRRRLAEHEHLKKEQEQNALLKDALDVAAKANAARSQFLSSVSHEMRTPLNAITGFLELSKGADKEKMENYIASSELAARQLLSVINDVLDMSSIESGKMKIACSPFHFKHIVGSITNIFGVQCRQKGIVFETRIKSPIDEWLIGDELRVNQILMNLLGNSVKFTSEGHVWLSISQTVMEDGKLFVRFEVADTGCGMSDEMKERLFKPFEQESVATSRKYGGSGLGLSIVNNLVGLMGGTIHVESEQNVGTTFVVELPFKKGEAVTWGNLPKKVELLRILAVDDEDAELEYIGAVLSRMGVRYKCVASGSDALAELERAEKEGSRYNVCLVDWRMPKMNGIETTSLIRRRYGEDVVVIVVSAYDFQQMGEKAKEAGANMFLSKPIFQSSLFDLLMTLTGGVIAKQDDEPQLWNFEGKRVLLAEDNNLNQIVATGYLARFNVTVDLAVDGASAVEKFMASPPGYYDAILMDIQMPVMDGFEATKAIRGSCHPDAKKVQIIAQTADAFNEDIAKAFSSGMNAHVAKPIKLNLLAKALFNAFAAK